MLWLVLLLDLSTAIKGPTPDDGAVYRQALEDHPAVRNVRPIWFHRCALYSFAFDRWVSVSNADVSSYVAANVVPALPPLPGFPGAREEVALSGILWLGSRASLELDFGGTSYCSTYRRDGASFKLEREVRLPREIGG